MCPPPPIPSLYNCGNRYGDSWYLDVRKAHDNKSTSFRANITGIWSRPTNGEKKPSWRAAGQKKRAGFSPLDWIRRIPEWRRLEEEGNLRVRAFSQGWWLEREQGRGGRGGQFPLPCIFLSHLWRDNQDRRQVGDRSSYKISQANYFVQDHVKVSRNPGISNTWDTRQCLSVISSDHIGAKFCSAGKSPRNFQMYVVW